MLDLAEAKAVERHSLGSFQFPLPGPDVGLHSQPACVTPVTQARREKSLFI